MRIFCVRRAVVADASLIADAHHLCFDDSWDSDFFEALLALSEVFGFIVETGGIAIGFVVGRCVADESEILTFGVVPAQRRNRIGSHLITAAMDEASHRGAARLFLEVDATDLAANHFYSARGFESVGGRRGYYRKGEMGSVDAVVMRRRLCPRP